MKSKGTPSKLEHMVRVLCLGALLSPVAAQAELLGYQYTNHYGEQQEIGSNAESINSVNEVKLALIAGIERKFSVSIYNAAG